MRIRPARLIESDRCAEIHIETRALMGYLPNKHTVADTIDWMRRTVFGNQQVLVAEVEGSVVGYASFEGNQLSNLYVLPAYQRRGIGSELLAEALREMPPGVELWVFKDNYDAIRFYQRHGFSTVRETSGDNEEGLPDWLMRHAG